MSAEGQGHLSLGCLQLHLLLEEAGGRGISLEAVCHQGLPPAHMGSPQHGLCVRKELCSPQILLLYHPGL